MEKPQGEIKGVLIKVNTPARKHGGEDCVCYIQNSKKADMNFKKPSRKDQSVNKTIEVLLYFYNLFYVSFMCGENK